MMNKTELAIIQKIANLDATKQARILEFVDAVAEENKPRFDLEKWLEGANQVRAEIVAKVGEGVYFDSVAILNEIREEESE
jgi:hypothetical protein